ncbi:MAG: PAS domain-containing protein [Candidatus Saccharicenans sp.]|jgi:PAS domain-containing protein|nr:PAS domain-containing protein [Candidatus Saccharicenans sp.]
MAEADWADEFPGAIIVTDLEGKIIYLNNKAALVYEAEGGFELLGRNLYDCHQPESRAKIARIMESKKPNVYTIEKQGIKKLIYQTTWSNEGRPGGLVEISLEIPFELPHFIRG